MLIPFQSPFVSRYFIYFHILTLVMEAQVHVDEAALFRSSSSIGLFEPEINERITWEHLNVGFRIN